MDLQLADVTTLAGAVVLTTLLVEAIKRFLEPPDDMVKRVAPIGSMVMGVLVVVLATLALGTFGPQAILTGILAGAGAAGLYDAVTSRKSA